MGDFVKCNCQHCGGHIEFERHLLSPKNNAVDCPHCGLNTFLYIPADALLSFPTDLVTVPQKSNAAKATRYQIAILRSFRIFDKEYLLSVSENEADRVIAANRVFKEQIRSLRENGVLREKITDRVEQSLFRFTVDAEPSEEILLHYIRDNFSEILLSENYGKSKSRRNQVDREIRQLGEYAPAVYVDQVPPRNPNDPDATAAQKRFLRDLGVRDEQTLAGLGKNAASELIEKVLVERRNHGI